MVANNSKSSPGNTTVSRNTSRVVNSSSFLRGASGRNSKTDTKAQQRWAQSLKSSPSWEEPPTFSSAPPTALRQHPMPYSSKEATAAARWVQQQRQQSQPTPVVSPHARRISPTNNSSKGTYTRFAPVVEPPSSPTKCPTSSFHRTSGGITVSGGGGSGFPPGVKLFCIPSGAAGTVPSKSARESKTDSSNRSQHEVSSHGSLSSLDAWRKYGKKFRANLILADDTNGGNSFTLSESCSIERYYRVADRVLEQFLTSDISEREDMIESYLIGNRLFKFLSVVLPTHDDYFSPDPKFTGLRVKSQNQLIELLQYMEELELIIDETEYNTYILTDLTPGQRAKGKPIMSNSNVNNSGSDETMTTVQNTSQSSLEEEEMHQQPIQNEVLPDIPESRNSGSPEDFGEESSHARQSNHSRRGARGGSSDDFAQRVAAVVAANSEHNEPNGPVSSLIKRSVSVASDSNDSFRKHALKFSDSTITDKPPPVTPRKSAVRKKKMKNPQYGLPDNSGDDHHTVASWGNATFGDFSDPFVTFEQIASSNSRIDLLLNEEPIVASVETRKRRPSKPTNARAAPLPTLQKKPPSAYPRSLRAKLQSEEAVASKSYSEDNDSSNASSDFSSDIFGAVEDHSSVDMMRTSSQAATQIVFKSKIEERLERAAALQREEALYDFSNYDDTSVVEFRPYGERNLMHQFRGCIRSLLD